MASKRRFAWQANYDTTYRLLISSRNEKTGRFDATMCGFRQIFGRETYAAASRERSKTKNIQTFTKDKFNPCNIKKHMQHQHPRKWNMYIHARDAKATDSHAFSSFFEQSKLTAFCYKESDVDG